MSGPQPPPPPPPPQPPPHGGTPKTTAGGSGLPPGKYDVFIIPEHSAGSGFLYLPSLQTNTNSFIAGFASALILVVLGQSMAPAFQAWWANFQGMGNAGMVLLVVAVGLGAWSLGRQSSAAATSSGSAHGGAGPGSGGFYSDGSSMPNGGGGGGGGASDASGSRGRGFTSTGSSAHNPHHGSPPDAHCPPPPGRSKANADNCNGSYECPPQPPPPEPNAKPQAETPKNSWEKAREEVRRKQEERKAREADEKRRAEMAQRLKELREKEARERAQREAERQRREQEAKERALKEQAEKQRDAQEKEAKERREKEQREAREKQLRERLAREREERRRRLEDENKRKEEATTPQARSSSAYAYARVGEKTNPWPNGKPPTAPPPAPPAPSPSSPLSTEKPPPPTAKTFVGDDSDAHSYRPYDQPKRSDRRRMSNSDFSESSWAPSQSTARTTPPASVRGPYSTKDPDKIVIKAVYCFMNQFAKTPASQLISGVGSVTDGLILRITTEGLFIDDDVRGVAQREWDVKAWTLKQMEVWCPVHFLAGAIAANCPPLPKGSKSNPALSPNNISISFFAKTLGGAARLRAAERGAPKSLTGDDADAYLVELLRSCKDSCGHGNCASKFAASNLPGSTSCPDDASSVASVPNRCTNDTTQTGDWKAKGLHLLRATIRDKEGKRYTFVISEAEGWKVAVGLQRLRRGTQVRALGVAGLSGLETKSTLEMLGWG